MQFEELSGLWNSTNTELEKSVRINRELVKQLGFSKVKSHLFEIKWTAFFEIFVEAIFTIFLIGFVINHISEFRFLFPAVVLFVFSSFSLMIEIYKLKLLLTIDSKFSVLEVQRKVSRLRTLEIFDTYSLYVLIPFYSVPFLIVIAKAFLNLSLYEFGIMDWFIYSVIGGLVIAIIIVFFLRKLGIKRLDETIDFLDELKEDQN